jgi:hypothetical protein
MPEADVVNPSSSDTEEALDLLFLGPAHGPYFSALNPHSGSDSDVFKDWPEVNDMGASVYVALTADASSSHASAVDAMCDVRESYASGSSGQQSRSWMTSLKKPR